MFQALFANGMLKILKWVAIATGLVLLYRYVAKNRENKHYQKEDKDVATNLAEGQAIALRAALNPSGEPILMDMDGANQTAIFKIASEIKDLQAVIDAYNSRYNGSLMHELEMSIGADGVQRFTALAGGAATVPGVNYSSVKNGVPAFNLVRTTKPTNARSTPKKTGLLDHSNILKTFDPYNVIGNSTGKSEYDAANDIIFVEVKMTNKRKQQVTFWVAKSQVEFINPTQYKQRKASGEKFTLQQLDGIGAVPGPELGTARPAVIYGEDFKPIDKVRERARLGPPTLLLRLPDRVLVRFVTVDGCRRWIDTRDVFLFLPTTF